MLESLIKSNRHFFQGLNAIGGKIKPLPVIGTYGEKLNLVK